MSKENFDALKATYEAISDDETKSPNMPVDKFLQEAEDLLDKVIRDALNVHKVLVLMDGAFSNGQIARIECCPIFYIQTVELGSSIFSKEFRLN